MREAPLGQDRSAARHDAGHPARGHRDVAQQHAGVDGEVVDALLRLLDQRVAIDLPGQILGPSADLLERLVDRDGADRDGGVPHDPLAGLVDVLPGREIHDRVGAPQRRPAQLVDFFFDRGAHRGVADVGVDLDREVAADDHRLELEVIDVGGDDGAAARDLRSHELGIEPFTRRDERHLRRDDALARVLELGHDAAAAAAPPPRARAASADRLERRSPAVRWCRRRGSVSPLLRLISRTGTLTPCSSTKTLREAGKASAMSEGNRGE